MASGRAASVVLRSSWSHTGSLTIEPPMACPSRPVRCLFARRRKVRTLGGMPCLRRRNDAALFAFLTRRSRCHYGWPTPRAPPAPSTCLTFVANSPLFAIWCEISPQTLRPDTSSCRRRVSTQRLSVDHERFVDSDLIAVKGLVLKLRGLRHRPTALDARPAIRYLPVTPPPRYLRRRRFRHCLSYLR